MSVDTKLLPISVARYGSTLALVVALALVVSPSAPPQGYGFETQVAQPVVETPHDHRLH